MDIAQETLMARVVFISISKLELELANTNSVYVH